MKPLVSIIVPIYKVAPYLRKCVDSILAQTLRHIEIILVDDGSPDQCGAICDDYAKRDSRVRVIHKQNGGQSSARNAGLDLASGDYIGFVDGDDYIHERMYEQLYALAEKYDSDIVVCKLSEVAQHDEKEQKDVHEMTIKHYSNLEALKQLYQPINGAFDGMGRLGKDWVYPVNKLYRKHLFKSLRFEKGRIYEDEFMIHRILYQCKRITTVSAHLYFYIQRPGSTINSPFSAKKFDRVYALKERADFFKTIDEKWLYHHAMRTYMEVFFWYFFKAKSVGIKEKMALKNLKKTMNKSLIALLTNPLISWKQKLMITLFVVNPTIYDLGKNIK
ncbi:glycosyltransferase family 2 protein [Camelliibacillus cellulosilyticus]|uniref:Glycosyltransferase family 2 protein n=1 Tax=Camelliibacillus cellulosilyticus TaxID=2174486 RepID=A0ABV9GT08_9BACL